MRRSTRAVDLVARLLLAGVGLATGIGLLGFNSTIADLANDFRPLLIGASALATATAFAGSLGWVRTAAAIVMALNLALTAISLSPAPFQPTAHASGAVLRVVSFNVWTRNTQLDRSRDWLAASGADIIVLQEFNERARREIVAPLQRLYPHVHDCRCNDIAILSRHPFTDAGGQPRTASDPALSWVTLRLLDRRPLRLIGVHTTYPKKPEQHAAHFATLAANSLLDHSAGPIALVGDFNATPWSWRFYRFVMARGLEHHGSGLASSWPSTPLPVLLLDNVVTSPDISRVSFEIGPHIGSDHRPVIATIALP